MTATTRTPGPELLDERSVGGVLVHLFALLTGLIGAGLVYLAASHEFTRANARNVLNWHLSVNVLTAVAVVTFFLGADQITVGGGEAMEVAILPGPLDTVFGVVGTVLLLTAVLAWLLTFAFTLVATGKAIFGTAWSYPGAPDLVGRVSRQ